MAARPLEPAIAAARGLTPRERAAAIRNARAVSLHFAHAVSADSAQMVQRIWNGLTAAEQAALAVVLAEAADGRKLLHVAKSEDEDNGMPVHVTRRKDRNDEGSRCA